MLCIIRGFRGIVEGKGNMRLTKKRADNGKYYLSGLAEVSNSYHEGYGRIQVGNAVEKLAEYEDLEEQNRLIKLPCALGDMVYVLRLDNTAYMMNNEKVWEIVEDKFEIFHFDSIGKTVFLTREAAEAALKELERCKGE